MTETTEGESAYRRRRDLRTTIAWVAMIGMLGFLLQVGAMDRHVGVYDEALTLYGAQQVAHGGVPYRDFWSLYGPAFFEVLGGAFRMLGESVLVERALDLVSRLTIVVCIFLLAQRLSSNALAAAAAICSLFFLIAAQSYGAPLFPSVAFALIAVLCADYAARQARSTSSWVATGLAIGLATLFRLDIGTYALLAAGVGLLHGRVPRNDPTRTRARSIGAAALGCALVVAPCASLLVWFVPLKDLLSDLIIIPLTVYAPNRSLPFPIREPIEAAFRFGGISPLSSYVVYVPMVVLGITLLSLMRKRAGHVPPSAADDAGSDRRLLWMIVVLLALLILKGSVRVQVLHMTPALATSSVLVAALAAHYKPSRVRTLATVLVVALSARIAFDNEARIRLIDRVSAIVSTRSNDASRYGCESDSIERMRCFEVEPALRDVIGYVGAHTASEETIYVGSTRHDIAFENDVVLYFLTGRRAATKWHDLHPGVETTLKIQEEMIADFEARRPALIILNQRWILVREPNRSAVSSAVTMLDEWIRAHYAQVYATGTFIVLAPRAPAS
jgi:hypothetical protein